MPDYRPTADFLRSIAGDAVILTHERPDGDAVGSTAGLAHYLQATGRRPEICFYQQPPDRYRHLLADVPWRTLEPGAAPVDDGRPWLLVDTCTYVQINSVAGAVKTRGGVDWVIDHHLARDPMYRGALLDETASAAGLLVFESVVAAGWKPHPAAAEALFTALVTDTGWMRFSSADARTYRAATSLVACGVKPDETYERLYQNDSPARLALVCEALTSLELHAGGTVALMALTQDSFRRARATPADTENLTDEAARLRGVNVIVMLVEMDNGQVRCSLRSKRHVDVNAVAGRFGGGGHARASGARIPGTMVDVKPRMLEAILEAVATAA